MIPSLYTPFRHWAEHGSVYIISDTHFGDPDCKLMDPDWISPEEQLELINRAAHKCDTLVHLGDVGNAGYIQKVNARHKVLLLGNHDRRSDYKEVFDEIFEGPLFISSRILLSHEPVYGLPWCLNIHGHDHNGWEEYRTDCKHLNLAANVCGYTPMSLGRLIKEGIMADIPDIHRMTIDRASKGRCFNE